MKQFCAQPGCAVLVDRGRCATHARAVPPSPRPTRPGDALYDRQAWRRDMRWSVLRDAPFCVACAAEGRVTLATDIDHIVKHDGDPARFWDRANVQGLCRSCHSRKTNRGE